MRKRIMVVKWSQLAIVHPPHAFPRRAEAGYDIAEARINKYYELFWAEPRKDRARLSTTS